MIPDPDEALELARSAALDAVVVCRRAAARLTALGQAAKADDSPVTVADYAAQAVIVRWLSQRGPVAILGEERADALRRPQAAGMREAVVEAVREVWPQARAPAVLDAIDGAAGPARAEGYWTVDPIDGTRGFIDGRQYAVCLAWIEHGRPRLAVMACPNLARGLDDPLDRRDPQGTIFVAREGEPLRWGPAVIGAPLQEAPRVPAEPQGPIRVTHSFAGTYSRLDDVARVLARLGGVEIRPADSQAKYGIVARGQAHVYLRIPKDRQRAEHIWDHAPGWLVATCAGMVVTDLAGQPIDFSAPRLARSYGVLCSTPAVHRRLVEAVAALGLQHRDG